MSAALRVSFHQLSTLNSQLSTPLHRPGDADGVRAAFVSGGGDDVDAEERGGAGGGEAGEGEELMGTGGGGGGEGDLVLGVVFGAGAVAEFVEIGVRIIPGGEGDFGLGEASVPAGGDGAGGGAGRRGEGGQALADGIGGGEVAEKGGAGGKIAGMVNDSSK